MYLQEEKLYTVHVNVHKYSESNIHSTYINILTIFN